MKTLFQTLLVLAASIGLAQAEITDDTMRGLQKRAAEKIEIEVLKTSKLPLPGGAKYKIQAKVTKVTESASGLKVGDEIDIRYHTSMAPGSYPNSVKKGESYKAYLRLEPEKKKHYEDVAGRGTFMAVE